MNRMLFVPVLLVLGCCNACSNGDATEPIPRVENTPAPAIAPLRLEPFVFADSAALLEHGPYIRFTLRTLRATGGDPDLSKMINDSLSAGIFGYIPKIEPFDSAVAHYTVREFDDYQRQRVEEEWLQEAPAAFAETEEQETRLVYQSDSLFVLNHRVYRFTGGAHGISYPLLLAFRTAPARAIAFDDLFYPGSEPALRKLLMAQARGQGVPVTVDSIYLTDNVAPLPEGVQFLYAPYEIAPYATGEVGLRLEYSALEGLIRPAVLRWVR